MRLAAVPSTAGRGFAAQRTALETIALLATAAGHSSAGPLHATHLPRLVTALLGDGHAEVSKAPYAHWAAHTAEWHLLQALLRQCDGSTAASQLLTVVPCFGMHVSAHRFFPLFLLPTVSVHTQRSYADPALEALGVQLAYWTPSKSPCSAALHSPSSTRC